MRGTAARRGTAVVAALALVALASALLASAAVVSSAGMQATLSERASLAAESAARRELGRAVGEWSAAFDALLVGQGMVRPIGGAGAQLQGQLAVQRLGAGLFALTVDVRAGAPPHQARRRARLLVQRRVVADTGGPGAAPVPIARWSMADLY